MERGPKHPIHVKKKKVLRHNLTRSDQSVVVVQMASKSEEKLSYPFITCLLLIHCVMEIVLPHLYHAPTRCNYVSNFSSKAITKCLQCVLFHGAKHHHNRLGLNELNSMQHWYSKILH